MAKPIVEVIKLGKRGELLLPRRVRSALRVEEGDELLLSVDGDRVLIERRLRQFSTYLDVMNDKSPREPVKRPVEEPPRRGLARFLTR